MPVKREQAGGLKATSRRWRSNCDYQRLLDFNRATDLFDLTLEILGFVL